MNKIKLYFVLLSTLLIFRSFFWEGISTKALYDFDEARYAEIAKNHLKTGAWLAPMAGGPDDYKPISLHQLKNGSDLNPYFWKPPLHTWTISLSFLVFGQNEFALRLPSLLFFLFSLVLVYKISLFLFPKRYLAPILAITFLSATNDSSFLSSQGLAETQLLFFSLTVIYFLFRRQPVLSGIALGLAFLTKSVATFWLFPLGGILILTNKGNIFQIIKWLSAAFLVAAPWHVYMYINFGPIFIDKYLLINTIGRGSGQQGNIAPIYWYLKYALDRWFPLIISAPIILLSYLKSKNNKFLLLLVWASLIFLPYSLSKSKVWWYIYPFWIPYCLLLSHSLVRLIQNRKLFITISFFLILITSFQTYQQSKLRPDYNKGIKTLAQRNKDLADLSVYFIPYESPLYYFDSGTIQRGITQTTQYLLTNTDNVSSLPSIQWQTIDSSNGVILLQKVN